MADDRRHTIRTSLDEPENTELKDITFDSGLTLRELHEREVQLQDVYLLFSIFCSALSTT